MNQDGELIEACKVILGIVEIKTESELSDTYNGIYENFYLTRTDDIVFFARNAIEIYEDKKIKGVALIGWKQVPYTGSFEIKSAGHIALISIYWASNDINTPLKSYTSILSTDHVNSKMAGLRGIYFSSPNQRKVSAGHDYFRKVEVATIKEIKPFRIQIGSNEFFDLLSQHPDLIEIINFLNGNDYLIITKPQEIQVKK